MKARVLNIVAAILFAAVLTGCSKLRAGDKFTAVSDGVEFQYEVIVSRMNYVRVVPLSGNLSGAITIPSTVSYEKDDFLVTQIGENAFRDCSGITSVALPKTLSTIEASAFAGCTSLESINTPQPLSVIGDYAFDGCVSLKEFSLDASISTLGKGCFRSCISLKTVEFPTSFTEIPEEAFYGCTSLQAVNCPSTIMKIGQNAFWGCIGIREITLDRSVQSIGRGAFAGCVGVGALTCMTATPPACFEDTFDGIPFDIPVTVMASALENYYKATGWSRFLNYRGVY